MIWPLSVVAGDQEGRKVFSLSFFGEGRPRKYRMSDLSATLSGSQSSNSGSGSEDEGVQQEGLDKMMELLGSDADLGELDEEEEDSASEEEEEEAAVTDKGKEKARQAVSWT